MLLQTCPQQQVKSKDLKINHIIQGPEGVDYTWNSLMVESKNVGVLLGASETLFKSSHFQHHSRLH